MVVNVVVPFFDPYYGTQYLGYPKMDHNFDNHPYMSAENVCRINFGALARVCAKSAVVEGLEVRSGKQRLQLYHHADFSAFD